MPIFEYRSTGEGCAHCREGFDHLQKLSDSALECCPQCGGPVQQCISAPALAIGGAHLLGEKKLGEKGFTQYRKIGKGVYEKTVGKGPQIIRGD
jgi:putative FmdB family regulatory protein